MWKHKRGLTHVGLDCDDPEGAGVRNGKERVETLCKHLRGFEFSRVVVQETNCEQDVEKGF